MNPELQVGDEAPDFQAAEAKRGETPSSFHLTGRRDGRVALCFYPYDDVPAATAQLSALRDAWERIAGKAALFGISRDTVENHLGVAERLGLPFPLLADEDNRIAKAYGIWLGEGGGGDVEGGSLTERATFILGRDGRIESILRDEKVADHVARLLDWLKV